MTLTENSTVREIALENPVTIRVFETLGMDYCCGGKHSLTEACARAGVPLETALALLATAASQAPLESIDPWNTAPLGALTAHIVTAHHGRVRSETPRIESLLRRVISRHGEAHPEIGQVEEVFLALSQELSAHMLKEEQVLFPFIEQMERAQQAGEALPAAFFGPVNGPIANLMADHDDAGALLARIRELTANFTAPGSACPTYRGLFQALAEFEADLHRHVHLENNILFPRAAELEQSGQ